mmetsp:Transcript_10129/g.22089  ORF Transcript_10129/g.22089 Transcript_10129/m.22089 type:complete len:220 (-) Transcript_10129:229-888(-)
MLTQPWARRCSRWGLARSSACTAGPVAAPPEISHTLREPVRPALSAPSTLAYTAPVMLGHICTRSSRSRFGASCSAPLSVKQWLSRSSRSPGAPRTSAVTCARGMCMQRLSVRVTRLPHRVVAATRSASVHITSYKCISRSEHKRAPLLLFALSAVSPASTTPPLTRRAERELRYEALKSSTHGAALPATESPWMLGNLPPTARMAASFHVTRSDTLIW